MAGRRWRRERDEATRRAQVQELLGLEAQLREELGAEREAAQEMRARLEERRAPDAGSDEAEELIERLSGQAVLMKELIETASCSTAIAK